MSRMKGDALRRTCDTLRLAADREDGADSLADDAIGVRVRQMADGSAAAANAEHEQVGFHRLAGLEDAIDRGAKADDELGIAPQVRAGGQHASEPLGEELTQVIDGFGGKILGVFDNVQQRERCLVFLGQRQGVRQGGAGVRREIGGVDDVLQFDFRRRLLRHTRTDSEHWQFGKPEDPLGHRTEEHLFETGAAVRADDNCVRLHLFRDIDQAGGRLGAIEDVLPDDRYEADTGPEDGEDELREQLGLDWGTVGALDALGIGDGPMHRLLDMVERLATTDAKTRTRMKGSRR